MKVLCIGGTTYDMTLPVDHFPVENKKTKINELVTCGGGSASNCAYLLAKWNIETYFAGVIGNDYYGQLIKNEFNSVGINTKYLEEQEKSTPISFIISNRENKTRTIVTNKDPNVSLTPKVVKESFDYIYLDGNEVEFSKNAIKANPRAIKIIDAGNCNKGTVELCKLCDYIICSKDFAEDYTNLKINFEDLDTIVDIYDMINADLNGRLIITLEKYGCFTECDGYKLIPSIEVNAVDTTGAGDIFHGAFVYGLVKNYDLIKNMKISNITAGLSITKIGGRHSIPRYGDVLKKYDELIKK